MIEVFFDCSSPWTYLAFHALLGEDFGEAIDWHDMYFGNDRLGLVRDAVRRSRPGG